MRTIGKRFNRIFHVFCLIIALFFYSVEKISGQNPVIEEIVEELATNSESEDVDLQSLFDDLNFYIENPLNLNQANIESLEKLHFLTDFQIENLLDYIYSKGPMKTIFELQLVDGFDMVTIQKLLPFVVVRESDLSKKIKLNDYIKYGNQKLVAETKFIIQKQDGYNASFSEDSSINNAPKYQGDHMKYLFRYKYNYKSKVYWGLVAEKDPGEKFEFDNQKLGFDYYSFHIQANDIGKFKTIILGDYQVKFGQGLIFWSGFGLGKSPDAINIRKKGQGVRYYSSTDENNFLRGAATSFKIGKLEATFLYSQKKIDANISETDTVDQLDEKINTLLNTGYHRTQTEIQNRKLISESIIGSRISIGWEQFKAGLNFVAYKYNIPFNQSNKPYQLFELKDNNNFNASFDYTWITRKMSLFGEAAVGKNGAIAVVNGLVVKVVSPLSFSILQRYYQKDYQANYAGAFAENSKVNNEQGFYYGLVFHPVRKLRISAYADQFRFPWLKYSIDAPSSGTEYLVQADLSLNRNVSMYFRWRNEIKAANLTGNVYILKPIIDEAKQNFRYHISYKAFPNVEFRSRIELVQFSRNQQIDYGFMLLQDVGYDFKAIPLSVDIRYCLFDANYDSRIFAYENDLLYNFSIPAYSGKGSRIYILAKYKLGKTIDLRVRYGQFLFSDTNVIGTNYDEIQGNVKSELKFQVLCRF
jgi:hypothetical protein